MGAAGVPRRDLDVRSSGASINAVSMRAGDLVDSLTIHMSDGSSHRFGGRGGGGNSCVTVPPGWMLLGFFGGEARGFMVYYGSSC